MTTHHKHNLVAIGTAAVCVVIGTAFIARALAAPAKNIPQPDAIYVPVPTTTAKAVMAYRDACVRFVEVVRLRQMVPVVTPLGMGVEYVGSEAPSLPVLERETEAGVSSGESEAWAAALAARGAIK